MLSSRPAYHFVALMFLVGVSMLAGYAVGVLFDLTERQIVFPIVLFAGLFLLVLVRMYGQFSLSSHRSEAPTSAILPLGGVSRLLGPHYDTHDTRSPVRDAQAVHERVLSLEEARQWLDALLVRQQGGNDGT